MLLSFQGDIMKDIVAILSVVFAIIIIPMVYIYKSFNYIIPNTEWNCTKSQMIDEKNVDKVECIRYEKVTKNDT